MKPGPDPISLRSLGCNAATMAPNSGNCKRENRMPDYAAQVLVCTNTENAEDRRHCGDKGGREVRQMFNELL